MLTSCDVLVVGGGPSGLSAALGARRAGADVVLCERFGCFGGVITTVGMETLGWYRYEGCMNDSEVPNGNSKLAKITFPKSLGNRSGNGKACGSNGRCYQMAVQ